MLIRLRLASLKDEATKGTAGFLFGAFLSFTGLNLDLNIHSFCLFFFARRASWLFSCPSFSFLFPQLTPQGAIDSYPLAVYSLTRGTVASVHIPP